MHPPRPTIADVAAAAGVSPATVSRALSNPGRVHPETVAAVRLVADQIGYRAKSHNARPERGSKAIVVLLTLSENSFYLTTVRAIEAATAAMGVSIMLVDARDDARAAQVVLTTMGQPFDGAILLSPRFTDRAILEIARRVPTVVINREVRGVPSVVQDSVQGMSLAVRHLVELGHRELTHLAGPAAARIAGARLRALEEVCSAYGVQLRTVVGDGTLAAGREAAAAWQARPTTAVHCFNDETAIGFVHAVTKAGFGVPTEVSVIGMGDNAFSVALQPSLTTLGFSASAQAKAVIERLFGTAPAQDRTLVPMRLIVRDSTGPAAR